MAKSRKLHRLITEQEEEHTERRTGQDQGGNDEGVIEEEDEVVVVVNDQQKHQEIICLPEFPGGAETFETVAKFCYGVKLDLTAWNVAPLRCAADYLEMTEEFSENNLIARTDKFLSQSVLENLRETIRTLKSCEELMPLADDLGITQRCIDSIAARASSDPVSFFSWPVRGRLGNQILWNGMGNGTRWLGAGIGSSSSPAVDSWFEDLAILSLPMYKRVIAALKSRELSSDAIEGLLISYAKRSIPGLCRSTMKHSSVPLTTEAEQRELLETVISNLPPPEKSSVVPCFAAAATTKFLFGLLRIANLLRASEASRAALEQKIASQLERATLDDLLIPSYSYLAETLYDVDCFERILAHFLAVGRSAVAGATGDDETGRSGGCAQARGGALERVGKLVDGYLAEIASDANLKVEKFCGLALALPEHARIYHDGLYRAIDIYLKAHPRVTQDERIEVCSMMDCRKLTLEACTHAAQNERLPLRAVLLVLFSEQMQLRRAIAGTILTTEGDQRAPAAAAVPGRVRERDTFQAAIRGNQVLRLDMHSMRNRVQELERECSSMKKAIWKLDGGGRSGPVAARGGGGGGRGRRQKMGCSFSTQVCDSHERNVVQCRTIRLQLSP